MRRVRVCSEVLDQTVDVVWVNVVCEREILKEIISTVNRRKKMRMRKSGEMRKVNKIKSVTDDLVDEEAVEEMISKQKPFDNNA
jgi:hypothetical protein